MTTHDNDLHQMLQRFWVLEERLSNLKPSSEDETCELHYLANHSRDSTGRYTVRPNQPTLGNSEDTAKRRFMSLERRLNSDRTLKEEYKKCMNN